MITARTHKNGILFKFYKDNKLVDYLHVDFREKNNIDYLVHKKRNEHAR